VISKVVGVVVAAVVAVAVPGVAAAQPPEALPYPERGDYRIKSIGADSWANKADIAGNNAGGVALNLVWAHWEPQRVSPPCAPGDEEYDGRCFRIPSDVDTEIREWTALGLAVTGVVYGTPDWARAGKPCSPVAPGYEVFCTPNDPADYGRFAGMLARRYDGKRGTGRVVDFVVQNEVNTNHWFDIGCGQGVACDTGRWLDEIAGNFNAAYDRVIAEQSTAKVLISLDNQFGIELERPAAHDATLSGMTVLRGLDARAGGRAWRLAFHPYTNATGYEFTPDDYPKVTYGNLGLLTGWLRATFPARVAAWSDVQLTESGVNSAPPSSPARQARAICDTFRNVLGTPGITNYVYHRMVDHPTEVAAGLAFGLHNSDGSAKPSWATWALANRADLSPPRLSCGFEHVPYTRLVRGYNGSRGHWASSRLLPPGFNTEGAWRLYRHARPDTRPLYECRVGSHNMLSLDFGCERQQPLGLVGHIHTAPQPGSVALHRCLNVGNGDHFISTQANCEGHRTEGLLGHALPL
jgi:hypothetical protein